MTKEKKNIHEPAVQWGYLHVLDVGNFTHPLEL